jgi:hypothetical protein
MLNPIPKPEPPSKTEQAKAVVTKTVKTISHERELFLAVLFLVLGFIMGKV